MRKYSYVILHSLLVFVLLAACQPVQLIDPEHDSANHAAESFSQDAAAKIEKAIEQTMSETQVPGLAVGIVKDGKVVYTRGFGEMELGKERLITPQSTFYWASVAKSVTATAIMQLVEQGKLDLDTPLTGYLPYFQMVDEQYTTITVRQLLSHMGGVAHIQSANRQEAYRNPEYDDRALERFVRGLQNEELLAAPGDEWVYSTVGFMILGDVIAKVSGQSYETYVQENIFVPLGMEQTTFLIEETTPDSLVSPHLPNAQGGVMVGAVYPYSRPFAAGSGILSNVEDMARYALAHLNRGELNGVRILNDAAYDLMWEPVSDTTIPNPVVAQYGLGWMIGEHNGYRTIGHDGLIEEFNAYFTMIPEDNLAVVLAVNYTDHNTFTYPAFRLRGPIFDALLEYSMGE